VLAIVVSSLSLSIKAITLCLAAFEFRYFG